jgi:lysozyme
MIFNCSVVDISHHNGAVDLSHALSRGVIGILHKATQGLSYPDPMYKTNLDQSRQNGLMWGAYHFGTGEDGVTQADAFLSFVQPNPRTLIALDLEANPQGVSMNLEDARAFVVHIQSVTGIWPGIYGGYYLKQLLGSTTDPSLRNCWFWLSQYGPTAVVPPNWPTWTLWQYTDGAIGPNPNPIPGIGHCDQNCYNGTPDQLRQKWANGFL